MQRVNLKLFADYFSVYLENEQHEDYGPEWTDEELSNRGVALGRTVILCPARNTIVPVTVEVHATEPVEELQAWDHVVECSIDLPSGYLLISGGTNPPKAILTVAPVSHQAKMFYAGLSTVSEDGLEGDDHYKIILWPGLPRPLRVAKRWPPET